MPLVAVALVCVVSLARAWAKEKSPTTYTIPLPPKADFSSVDWLVGEWAGDTVKPGPEGDVNLSVAYGLEKHFLVFREAVSLLATKTAPAMQETWMGVLSARPDGKGFILRVFSSTGFVSKYDVVVDANEIRFSPAGGDMLPSGWLFRRTFLRASENEFVETVQVAPPSQSFFDYYSVRLARVLGKPSGTKEQ